MKLKKMVSILSIYMIAVAANAGIVRINQSSDFIDLSGARGLLPDLVKNIQKSNTLALVNNYAKSPNALVGATKDAEYFNKQLNTVVLQNVGTAELDNILDVFSSLDCSVRKDARIIWFSGHAYNHFINDESGFRSHHYSFITNTKVDENTGKGMYEISRMLAKLASSDCNFIVGIDADPSLIPLSLPRNVSAIWAGSLGSNAFDTPNGGALTLAFAKAIAKDKLWTANSLTTYLQSVMVDNPSNINFTKPWVQAVNPDDTIYLPTVATPAPDVRVVPVYPTLIRKKAVETELSR